jgi:hypothetical protein
MKIISVIKNGRRVDIPQEKFQKILEETKEKLEKQEKDTIEKSQKKEENPV